MLNVLGTAQKTCEGVSRRNLLQAGGAGLLGLNLPKLMAAESQQPFRNARAKSVVFLFLFGGPSQLETFDMKPEATATIRGPLTPIASRTPGLRISELLPKTANISNKLAVVRNLSHSYNDHSGAGHYIQTGHRWHVNIGGGFNVTPQDWPSMGSVVEYLSHKEQAARNMSSYAVVPNSLGRLQTYKVRLERPGETAGWLGRGYDPLTTRVDKKQDGKDNPYWRDMTDEELTFQIEGLVGPSALTLDRLNQRRNLLDQFDAGQKSISTKVVDSYNQFQQRALSLVTSPKTRDALDITNEPAKLRDTYGRHLFGQASLMARRLVEAGTRFVTVHYDCVDGYSWDSHRNSNSLKNHLVPTLDQALSSLINDLDDRGLLDETLVVAVGEMGRTPKANSAWGRNHWSTLFPAVVAGAGISRGGLFGESDKDAGYSTTQPVAPEDLAATIYHALGIDPELRVPDQQGRPVQLVEGEPQLNWFS
jgi:uncharacterized protein (DUF1501 family)